MPAGQEHETVRRGAEGVAAAADGQLAVQDVEALILAVMGLQGRPAPAPGPFALADADRVERLLVSARFRDVSLEPIARPMRAGSDVNDTVAFFESTDLARRLMADAPPGKIAAALGAIRAALVPYSGNEGVVLNGTAWLVTARKP